jgi:hypothetical protein
MESSSTEMILYYTRTAEEIGRKKQCYQGRKCLIEGLSPKKDTAKSKTMVTQVKEPMAKDQSPEQSKTQLRDYPRFCSQTRERYPYDTLRAVGHKN